MRVLRSPIPLIVLLMAPLAATAEAEQIIGLTTDNRLVTFDSESPGTILTNVAVTGLRPGETLWSIDIRPRNGLLYSLGSSNTVYTLDPATGAVLTSVSVPTVSLAAGSFGIDFNPVPDSNTRTNPPSLRVVAHDGRNLRINADTGVPSLDRDLGFAAGDLNRFAVPNVAGSAYTNNVFGATSTTLFGIDSSLDALVIQAPPNDGTLRTIAPLGFNTSDLVGFDISGVTGVAYASMTAPGTASSQLFRIDLDPTPGTSPRATRLGAIGTTLPLRGLAVAAVPEPSSLVTAGLGLGLSMLVVRRRLRPV